MTLDAFLRGFFLGIGLIVAIGAQNAFVLRQGLRREHVLAVVLACALSDAVLIAIGVFALASVTQVMPALVPMLRWGGVAFLSCYGALAFRRAFAGGAALDPGQGVARPLAPVLATCLALTWFNPHVYLDTVLLVGSVATGFPGARGAFAAGAMTASFVFFFALGFGARLLEPIFVRPLAWRWLDAGIGVVMWAIAFGLAIG
ncbi:LysE/ArgO family amino acid transporter [Tropicimonas sp. IMCC34043]|uniref:LysE/ArgO family amino acid transporter n=1 Tax=Tropicimonas sp. IMCC34043 TaxID=2248760 RepID=UPI000E26D35F|nr:LysE/ArgO family amino acid transporter [Tropicimonas sp. IMCC34043]